MIQHAAMVNISEMESSVRLAHLVFIVLEELVLSCLHAHQVFIHNSVNLRAPSVLKDFHVKTQPNPLFHAPLLHILWRVKLNVKVVPSDRSVLKV